MTISLTRAALYGTTLLAGGVAIVNAQYLFQTPENFSFVAQRETYSQISTLLYLHICGGAIALLTGPLQFFRRLRAYRGAHAALGRIYVSSVMVSGLTGLPVAAQAFGGFSNSVAFGLLSVLWLVTTYRGLWHIQRGELQAHRIWMVRSFALTFAAVTLRLELGILAVLAEVPFSQAYLVVPWTCWVLNLLFVEWFVVPRMQHPGTVRSTELRIARSPVDG